MPAYVRMKWCQAGAGSLLVWVWGCEPTKKYWDFQAAKLCKRNASRSFFEFCWAYHPKLVAFRSLEACLNRSAWHLVCWPSCPCRCPWLQRQAPCATRNGLGADDWRSWWKPMTPRGRCWGRGWKLGWRYFLRNEKHFLLFSSDFWFKEHNSTGSNLVVLCFLFFFLEIRVYDMLFTTTDQVNQCGAITLPPLRPVGALQLSGPKDVVFQDWYRKVELEKGAKTCGCVLDCFFLFVRST